MADTDFAAAADGGPDDLPRTLRREREARAREAEERAARERQARDRHLAAAAAPAPRYGAAFPAAGSAAAEAGTVTRFEVPFLHLAGFFLKAVLAALPALALLAGLLWGAGEILRLYFPQLVKMQIVVFFGP